MDYPSLAVPSKIGKRSQALPPCESARHTLPIHADTIPRLDDFREMAQDPKQRCRFERLLYLTAQRGDADLVAERLCWGIDPNCRFSKGRTPQIANVGGSCPSVATVRALLKHGAIDRRDGRSQVTALLFSRDLPGPRAPTVDVEGTEYRALAHPERDRSATIPLAAASEVGVGSAWRNRAHHGPLSHSIGHGAFSGSHNVQLA